MLLIKTLSHSFFLLKARNIVNIGDCLYIDLSLVEVRLQKAARSLNSPLCI